MTGHGSVERQLSLFNTEVDRGSARPILEGSLDHLPVIGSRTVRIFLSSTFSDMTHERDALMENVYPRLKEFCREKLGLEFQVVDLRWGIRQESQDDHTIIDFCLKEIDHCMETSVGPFFIALIGQKYGYRPFPPKIDAVEFDNIKKALEATKRDVRLLSLWYKKDVNVIPPVYTLQPISSILKHYNCKDNEELRKKDQDTWDKTFSHIQVLLRDGAQLCLHRNTPLTKKDVEKYFTSVTEYEIQRGLLEARDPLRNCLCFVREVTNLEEQATSCDNPRAHKYMDMVPYTNIVEFDAQNLLKVLKNSKIPDTLEDERNTEYLVTDWVNPEDTEPTENPEYLEQFCTAFHDKVKWLIIRNIRDTENMSSNMQLIEVLQHLNTCRSRSLVFRGREDVLEAVKTYFLQEEDKPLVVYGQSGSGKTSVLAKSASLLRQWRPNSHPVIVLRFLGTTVRSCSIRLVLGSVCWQIASAYDVSTADIPGDYPGLVAYFNNILQVATRERPLVIFLDSLDQLTSTHRAFNLAWLPHTLPPNVHMVLATLPHEHDLLSTLHTLIQDQRYFLQILPLGRQLSAELIREWLSDARRSLTPTQYDIVNSALTRCSLPLYTRLIFEDISRWCSYMSCTQTRLETTVKGVINTLFDRLEKYHGKTFVSHVLSYLTASRNGLSDMELEDVLSLDDTVLNDVFLHWLPPIRRIPPLLWPRLHNELRGYIIQREANGTLVYFWYHRQFISVTRERYLNDLGHKLYIHGTMAHYFLGTWGAGERKAFRYSMQQMSLLNLSRCESEADRKVPQQPLQFDRDPRHPSKPRYNLRKLSELPYHLIESRRHSDLKQEVLFHYEWLHSKLSAMSLHDLLSDFRSAVDAGLHDIEVQLLFSALRVGGSYVNQNPDTLAFDLLGRLLPYYDTHMSIRSLLQQCDALSLKHSALVPLYQCFESPRGMLLYILEDHTQVVYDLIFSCTTNELVSVSKDNTIAFWDLSTGEQVRTINIASLNPGPNTRLFQSSDGKYLVCDSDTLNSPVHVFDFKTGHLLHECGRRLATQKRTLLVGHLLCRQKNIIDIRNGVIVKTLDDFVKSKRYVTCGITPNGRYILIGEDNVTTLFDFDSGFVMAQFFASKPPSIFAVTPDSSKVYIGYTEDCLFKAIDIAPDSHQFGSAFRTFNYKAAFPYYKFLEGPRYGKELAEISISPRNNDVVLLNIKRCHLIIFNVATCNAKLIDVKSIRATNQTYLFSSGFLQDGKQVVAGLEHFIHIWHSDSGRLVTTINLHSTHKFPLAISPTSNLIATGSLIHTAIKVWDVDRVQLTEGALLHVYENPVDMMACGGVTRLVFVKRYYGLMSRGYKYLDSFGIDVWNMSTGRCEVYLPFDRYGQLEQMSASHDGRYLGLLLRTRTAGHVLVVCLTSNKVICCLPHPEVTAFTVSANWLHMVTWSEVGEMRALMLWDITTAKCIVKIPCGKKPVFSYDCQHLLYIDGDTATPQVIVYSLKDMAPLRRIPCTADSIQTIPGQHKNFLATRLTQENDVLCTTVEMWDFTTSTCLYTLENVAPSGLLDFSKDGTLGVDSYLTVYNLVCGEVKSDLSMRQRVECQYVRFTSDGLYLVWVHDLTVNVSVVRTTKVIAHTSTHEKPTSLVMMDSGYLIVLGREDGHLLTMKLIIDHSTSTSVLLQHAPPYREDRTRLLLAKHIRSHESIKQMDPIYQVPINPLRDSELPCAGDEMKSMLVKKATVPHAIIKTGSHPNLKSIEVTSKSLDRGEKRRGSSPYPKSPDGNSAEELSPGSSPVVRSKENVNLRRGSSPISHLFSHVRSSECTPSNSPMIKLKTLQKRSCSSHDVTNGNHVLHSRSKSLQDLFSLSTKAPPKPVKPKRDKEKRKSPLPNFLINPMAKALQNTSQMVMAFMGGESGATNTPNKPPIPDRSPRGRTPSV